MNTQMTADLHRNAIARDSLTQRLRDQFTHHVMPVIGPLLEKAGLWAPPLQAPLDEDVEPGAWAERFASAMQAQGYALDFSLESAALIDSILDSRLFHDYNLVIAEANISPDHPDRGTVHFRQVMARYRLYRERETGASAYIGELLRRHYDAVWVGSFSPDTPLRNQYLSRIQLGEQVYNPSQYVIARLGGGRCCKGGIAAELNALITQKA